MKILAFDTALRALSAAVLIGDEVKGHCFEERNRGHAEALLPMIDDVCRKSGVDYADFDRIAVTVGPGTFAGVRVGLASARGLAAALNIPVVGLGTLEVMAAGSLNRVDDRNHHVTAVIDARRGQVYCQTFDCDLQPLNKACACAPADVASMLPKGPGVLVGDAADVVQEALKEMRGDLTVLPGPGQPDAAIVAQLAPFREASPPGTGSPQPMYLRPPDARLPGGKTGIAG